MADKAAALPQPMDSVEARQRIEALEQRLTALEGMVALKADSGTVELRLADLERFSVKTGPAKVDY